jgi:hypothetical protein
MQMQAAASDWKCHPVLHVLGKLYSKLSFGCHLIVTLANTDWKGTVAADEHGLEGSFEELFEASGLVDRE